MQTETAPSKVRLNCVRMTKADSITLINALIEVRRELLEEGFVLAVRKKPLIKTNSTLRKR